VRQQPPTNDHEQEPVQEQIQEKIEDVVAQAQAEVSRSHEPWYRVSRRARILVGIDILIFVLFTLLAWFVHVNPIVPVDVAITREFQENQSPWLKNFMIAVSFLGNHWLIFGALILLTAVVFWIMRLRLEALLIGIESIVSSLLNELIKVAVGRPRPTARLVDVILHASGQSFPSGHVMSYVAFFGLVFSLCLILFRRDRWWNYVLLTISGLFVVLVGPSRIYLGDHWASDVLGGYLFGGLLLGISLWIYIRLKARGILTKPIKHRSLFSSRLFKT
jgi:membrane-associated phospholipid phosphatase